MVDGQWELDCEEQRARVIGSEAGKREVETPAMGDWAMMKYWGKER